MGRKLRATERHALLGKMLRKLAILRWDCCPRFDAYFFLNLFDA